MCGIIGSNCLIYYGTARNLQTSRTYCATKTEDLTAVIEHVKKRFPGSPVMAVGVSLGGYCLFISFCLSSNCLRIGNLYFF